MLSRVDGEYSGGGDGGTLYGAGKRNKRNAAAKSLCGEGRKRRRQLICISNRVACMRAYGMQCMVVATAAACKHAV